MSTANTQIGAQAMLAVSIGVGFRLDQPSILVHEAAVWEALKAASPSIPLFEAALPKQRAEWLLAGRASHPVARGTHARYVDWTAWAELDGVRKIVSCAVPLDDPQPERGFAQLVIDHPHAAAGGARENPLGVTSGTPPLQQMRTLGIGPAPLAAMGAIGTDWPERAQWTPARMGTVDVIAHDGTHMGWPTGVDLRFFQQAAPDQWARGETWGSGARFQLAGFGPRGEGYAGDLPRLVPVALVTSTARPGIERLSLRQQTVWFLPDHGIGVLWWNGTSALDFLLDDSPAMLVAAFKDESEPVDVDALMRFASQRTDLNCSDPLQYTDHELMPSIGKGWTWDMILDADDHPRFAPASRRHDEMCVRVQQHRTQLLELREAQERLAAFSDEARDVTLPEAPHGEESWRHRLQRAGTRELADVTIRDADLSSMRFDGWKLDDVRFERCRFDRSEWARCRFSRVHATDCSFAAMKISDGQWKDSQLRRCNLAGSNWTNVVIQQMSIDECELDELTVSGGKWSMTSLHGCRGARGYLGDVELNSMSWAEVSAIEWKWERVHTDGFALVECEMPGLIASRCTLGKLSVLTCDLSGSLWQRNAMTFVVLSLGTSMNDARLTDCVLRSSSLLNLRAERMRVDHCSFIQLNAPHLHALQSHWSEAELDGANLMHAQLADASFVRCSLTETMLYGANLRRSQMHDCNLARARLSWIEPPEAGAWRHNLTAGLVDAPVRT